jgi:protein-S-isoprenylcysteine O-methyltransferase Ste14
MTEVLILLFSIILVILVIFTVVKAIVKKQQILGKPAIPAVFFITAKLSAFAVLFFLFFRAFGISVSTLFRLPAFADYIALLFLIAGTILILFTSIRLKDGLIFGLSGSKNHKVQTKGIYRISRHPFYLGFLFVLFSSVLFVPNLINIVLFVLAWILHHFIMISEEKHLSGLYGEEYVNYIKNVRRYLNIF